MKAVPNDIFKLGGERVSEFEISIFENVPFTSIPLQLVQSVLCYFLTICRIEAN